MSSRFPRQPSHTIRPSLALILAHPAVTSSRQFLGKRRWKAVEGRYLYLARHLQKRGTKSAKRHLRQMRGRRARFRRDCDHVLSRQIVQAAPPGSAIVFEHLTHIRTRTKQRGREQRRRMHSWSFARLQTYTRYKAEARGCTVDAVDPRHTSQTCSRCGHQARNNRRARGLFTCRMCGYTLHADLNAAYNIAAKYQAAVGIPDGSGLTVNQPIASAFGLGASRLL